MTFGVKIDDNFDRDDKKWNRGVFVLTWPLIFALVGFFVLSCFIVGLAVHFTGNKAYADSGQIIRNWNPHEVYSGPQTESPSN